MSILRSQYGRNALSWQEIVRDPVLFCAFGFGSGLSRYMPGTLGTLVAVPLCWGLQSLGETVYLLVLVVSCVLGVWLCDQAARKLGEHDYGGIVWDELAGYWLTMLGLSATGVNLLLGFVAFRFFDIVKPWPIRWLDRHVHGGLGIMLDDLLAGVFAALSVRLVLSWL